MTELSKILRTEISRLAKKEARGLIEPTHKSATVARQDVAALKRRLGELERELATFKKSAGRPAPLGSLPLQPAPVLRYSAKGVRAQRDRFGMSAEDFGKLLGVSSQAIYNWEHGSARPRPALLEKLAVLRAMNKREAMARVRLLNGNGAKKP